MSEPFRLNLLCALIGILLGFLSGLLFGLFFHRENWLGGYGSFKRRMYRLAHISFFGLGFVNLAFYFTARVLSPDAATISLASKAFLVGAATMPLCCILLAHRARALSIFTLPVGSLLLGGGLTIAQLLKVMGA